MGKSNFQRYFYTCLWVSTGMAIGVLFVIIFCVANKLNIATCLLWSFAFIVMGALLGFIFSVPKIISDNQSPQPLIPGGTSTAIIRNRVEENTNLTQISDWLTKVLIGAGLVQLKEIPGFILHLSKVIALGIRNGTGSLNTVDFVTIMCAAIVLFFSTWGFISGYLVMKLVLTEQFAE
jgi:hypothetical protein